MALTEKGRHALELALEHYSADEYFSAKELSGKVGETIVAATLTAVCNNGYMVKKAGSPVTYALVKEARELLELEPVAVKKGQDNGNLRKANAEKNDEFYTRYMDIADEVLKYKKYFNNRVVLLPCDDHGVGRDNFWRFFVDNFESFGLKKLIAIHYSDGPDNPIGEAYKVWVEHDVNNDGFIDEGDAQLEYLQGNGDFRSDECRELFKEADIIVTNPPFSLFREFVAQIMEFEKQFLIIGNKNAFTYKEIFPLIKENKIWVGYIQPKDFINIDGQITGQVNGLCRWFTNLPTKKREEELILTKSYNPTDYPKYDNYDAIEVGKVVNIPKDYNGVMGVPITFLDKYNPNQFEIIGGFNGYAECDYEHGLICGVPTEYYDNKGKLKIWNGPTINKKTKYFRLLIRKK